MSWAGGTFTYPVSMGKEKIEAKVNEELYQSRGCMEPVPLPFIWKDSLVFENEEDAQAWLDENMGKYRRNKNVAVKYIERTRKKETAKEKALTARIAELYQKREQYSKEHSVKNRKSAFIGCPKCSSSLSREYIDGNTCPLCRADLRSKTTIDTLKRYQERIDEANKALSNERKKHVKGDETRQMWMIEAEMYIG